VAVPELQADSDAHPRNRLVVVGTRDAAGTVSTREFVFNINRGPSGHKLAAGS
jgi:hypothetical protein